MSDTFYKYNPFTLYGRYNINQYIYKNKKQVITILFMVCILLILAIVIIYTSPINIKQKPQISSPTAYGYGPFGWGEYLLPKDLLAESLLL